MRNCRWCFDAARSSRRGLSRIELMFLLIVLVILVFIAYVPISAYFVQHGVARAVQCGHTLGTLLAQYATDNDGVYPIGEGTPHAGKSEGIALNLLQNNYTPDASLFAVGSTPRFYGPEGDYAALTPQNLSWDFTAGANSLTGLPASAPDNVPVAYTTGQPVAYASTSLTLSGRGPFGSSGVIVAYKNQSAKYIPASSSGNGAVCPGFISPPLANPAAYTQITP